MYYNNNLLKQFISIQDDPKSIGKNLTNKACEIEKVIERKIPDLVVIWFVYEVTKHPDADKLFVCQLDCGSFGKYQICTGGENVKVGIFVPVAMPWCYLWSIDLKIEPRKMRWLESNGMICSKEELGILEDSDKHRIWDMSQDFQDIKKEDIGKKLSDKYPRLDNVLREVDNKNITHRPDLTWHFGVANELYAIYKLIDKSKIKFQKIKEIRDYLNTPNILNILQNSKKSNKKILNKTNLLRSYLLIEINNVSIKNSSFFLRLQCIDLEHTPKNNWVDFSNLFMDLTWNPIHFFDQNLINWDVIVRQAIDWEYFEDLLGWKHTLRSEDIVIADNDWILALAWIIWWARSAISTNTKNILAEIANFDPISVRKTSKRIGIRTDAVMRFEKDINPVYSTYLLNMFLDSMKMYSLDLWSYDIWGLDYFIDQNIEKEIYKKREIFMDIDFVSKLIFGENRSDLNNNYIDILESLWFEIKN